jgi:hypothetical protein
VAIAVAGAGSEQQAASGNCALTTLTFGAESLETDDVIIAVVHSSDQVAHAVTGWTEVAQGDGGGTLSHLSVWWFRYAGVNPGATVTHTAGSGIISGTILVRGAKKTGSPIRAAGVVGQGTDTTIEHAAITPTANDLLLVINGTSGATSRTLLADYTAAFEDGSGGTQNSYIKGAPTSSVAAFYRLAPGGDTGEIVVTQSGAGNDWAGVLVALEPEPAASGGDEDDDFVDANWVDAEWVQPFDVM